MNREIKFRAWWTRYDEPIMLQLEQVFNRFDYEDGLVMSFSVDSYEDFAGHEWYDVKEDEIVIMQYTGLKDKNGVEIYEGDVLENEFGKKEIVWIDGCFCAKEENSLMILPLYFSPLDLGKCEVIGNIHQNPELL